MSFLKLGLVGATLFSVLGLTSLQAQETTIPANCQLLKEVSTGATEITKKIESLAITNNFNTDFAIPAGVAFTSYQAMMQVENEGKYDVTINLKYPDESSATAIDKKQFPMVVGQNYSLPFNSPTDREPYQVNFNIAGANNNSYTISVMACQ